MTRLLRFMQSAGRYTSFIFLIVVFLPVPSRAQESDRPKKKEIKPGFHEGLLLVSVSGGQGLYATGSLIEHEKKYTEVVRTNVLLGNSTIVPQIFPAENQFNLITPFRYNIDDRLTVAGFGIRADGFNWNWNVPFSDGNQCDTA